MTRTSSFPSSAAADAEPVDHAGDGCSIPVLNMLQKLPDLFVETLHALTSATVGPGG
jgi:hypothetical protein